MDSILTLTNWIKESKNIVFFGGAGCSTESGIPDFRSSDGLYSKKYGNIPCETILSRSFFKKEPEIFYEFYRKYLYFPDAKPNNAHKALKKLEDMGKNVTIVTQNIDNMHQLAGSSQVLELHGTLSRNYCENCHKSFDSSFLIQKKGIPRCECGGLIRPDIVLYEESLDEIVIKKSLDAIYNADLLIVGGTSLVVSPANTFIRYFKGNRLVLINLSKTPYDKWADLVIHEKIGYVLNRAIS